MSRSADRKRIAVLGAGIMGSCLAVLLARRRVDVVLYDTAPEPMSGASRWNEGKIHLGYLYAADPSRSTAQRLLGDGLAFARIMEEIIGEPLGPLATPEDDIFLIHRRSVVGVEAAEAYYRQLDAIIRDHPDAATYLRDASRTRTVRLGRTELERIADPERIVAGFRTPERSVPTCHIADRLVAALAAEPRITLANGCQVTGVAPIAAADGPWRVRIAGGQTEDYDCVVNALWHGRPAIDATAGLAEPEPWLHRYRVSLFVTTQHTIELPSAVIAVGPFGDVKCYNGRDFYLSWYPAGLLAEAATLEPPKTPHFDAAARQSIIDGIRDGLRSVLPAHDVILAAARTIEVEGGYVFARGSGQLDDPGATLHRRDGFGIARLGNYISVDTGKYSSAPALARSITQEITGD